MNKRPILAFTLLTILSCGCTTTALRRNAFNQSKTVGEFLADQVLYNLALYDNYYVEKTNFNGIPSFIKLSTGQSQVQQSVSGQLGLKFPIKGGDEIDPQITGNHQTQDNWTFLPVVDPSEIKRLFYLYRSQFQPITNEDELKILFPDAPPDSTGRPLLNYKPIRDPANTNTNSVLMISNQPQFTATYEPVKRSISAIPGALDGNKRSTNTWFKINPSSNIAGAFRAEKYLGKEIWITDRENFFKFALLTLGPTNNLTPQTSAYLQNGVLFLSK